MSQLQDLARCLLAAGYASHVDGQGMYLLSTDEGTLISKDWTGESFGKEELIATSVRPDSSAAILVTPDDNVIIGITAASTLAAFQFDEDEEEWVQDRALSAYTVHAKGKLSACHTSDQRICIVFQDVRGALVRVEENDSDDASESSDGGSGWMTTVLEKACEPMLGTPISLMLDESGLHVFYVSEADKRIHRLREGGPWADEDISEHAFGPLQALALSRGSEEAALTTVDMN
ncbi:hypothetical protein FOMPIDRAFT_82823 [Fomitopsis schrenkii]|uniref:CNH domain-containing protein n=1 Tax=Fomitopsis schrenkii TaxID=2126942 RepID=S8EKX6_FOMSC|nr:hypothetical protein FOMPIDRAFT_82823 [Fomitopsis schrenkii]